MLRKYFSSRSDVRRVVCGNVCTVFFQNGGLSACTFGILCVLYNLYTCHIKHFLSQFIRMPLIILITILTCFLLFAEKGQGNHFSCYGILVLICN